MSRRDGQAVTKYHTWDLMIWSLSWLYNASLPITVEVQPRGRGGFSLEFLEGVCRLHLQIQTQYQTKKCHFPHPFLDLASKIHTCFQTWPCTWLSIAYASVLKGGQCNKDEYVKFSWNDIFYHFSSLLPVTRPGCWEENKFISFHERSPDNHTQFQTKMFKTYTRFQTKTAQKPYPLGQHVPIYLI